MRAMYYRENAANPGYPADRATGSYVEKKAVLGYIKHMYACIRTVL